MAFFHYCTCYSFTLNSALNSDMTRQDLQSCASLLKHASSLQFHQKYFHFLTDLSF